VHRIFRNLKKWSILISCNNNQKNEFNYIYNKLNYLINKEKLNESIEILYLINDENISSNRKLLIEKSKSEWINFIDVNIDISNNFINEIFKNLDTDYIKFKKHFVNQNKSLIIENDYSFVIKKSLISDNYYNNNFFKPINSKILDNVLIFEKNEKKENISIIITAYESQDFIEECLNSVYNQTYFNNDNFEVLVGVDGCKKTYEKLNEIKYNYKNLKIFMMKDNKGTYITTNTLIEQTIFENIIRFDSDDTMFPTLVENVMDFKNDYDIVKIGSFDGIIYFKKSSMIDTLGGYQPWFVAADTELLKRAANKLKIGNLNIKLFNRRYHTNSLTNKKDTAIGSKMRNFYSSLIKTKYNDDEIKIDRVTNEIEYINKKSISIIITAYQTENFIEECLDSIENQTYFIDNNDYEILVGIDACEKTLEKLKKINHKYRNLKIFMMDSNMGTYVTSNTLLDLVKYDNILRFDSDDIMKPIMIEEIMKYSDNYDIIRFSFNNFNDNINNYKHPFMYAYGAIFYKKNVINISGGYKDWICSADLELFNRTKNKFKIKEIDILFPLFFRRNHNNSLCNKKDTSLNSEFRKKINLKIRIYEKNENIKIKKITNTYKIIFENNINNYFDKIYCVNLDRRKDKWDIANKKFNNLNIIVNRFSAYDGNLLDENLIKKYKNINKYEIGCMLSHYDIIKDAKLNNYKKILILEDDVLFVENFHKNFSTIISKLPENYKMLYLGATQHNWDKIEYINNFYYANNTDGAFAYVLKSEIYDDILKTTEIDNKPIDYKLWDIQKKYYKDCYVCFPNLIISDVSDSNIRQSRDNTSHKIKMKWNIYNYE